jgi:hypothetical protein
MSCYWFHSRTISVLRRIGSIVMETSRDTRETVESEFKYVVFDALHDQYKNHEISLEQLAAQFLLETSVDIQAQI